MSRLSLSEPETPASTVEGGEGSSRAAMRSPMLKGCGINLLRVDRDDLRRRVWIPARLRVAMADAVRSKDPQAAAAAAMEAEGAASEGQGEAPAAPLIVFVNSRSGGRNGPVLKGRLLEFIGEEQIYNLTVVKPSDLVHYGLACLEKMATLGDDLAKTTRENMRVLVAGGDGTVGWLENFIFRKESQFLQQASFRLEQAMILLGALVGGVHSVSLGSLRSSGGSTGLLVVKFATLIVGMLLSQLQKIQ